MGESGLHGVRTIRYIVVLPVVIFSGDGRGEGEKPLSDSYIKASDA